MTTPPKTMDEIRNGNFEATWSEKK